MSGFRTVASVSGFRKAVLKHYLNRGTAHPEVAIVVDNAVREETQESNEGGEAASVIYTDQIRIRAHSNREKDRLT